MNDRRTPPEGARWAQDIPDWTTRQDDDPKGRQTYLDSLEDLRKDLEAVRAELEETKAAKSEMDSENAALKQTIAANADTVRAGEKSIETARLLQKQNNGMLQEYANFTKKHQDLSKAYITQEKSTKRLKIQSRALIALLVISVLGGFIFVQRTAITYNAQLEAAQSEITTLEETVTGLEGARDAALAERDQLAGRLESYPVDLADLREQIQAMQRQVSEIRAENQRLVRLVNPVTDASRTTAVPIPARITSVEQLVGIMRMHVEEYANTFRMSSAGTACLRQYIIDRISTLDEIITRRNGGPEDFGERFRNNFTLSSCYSMDRADRDRYIDRLFYRDGNAWDVIISRLRIPA